MQLDARDHFEAIVIPSIEAYQEAETALSLAVAENASDQETDRARHTALRLGGAAAFYLHHFADIVANRGLPAMPAFNGNVRATMNCLTKLSIKHFGESDVSLLADVADALKHSVLTRRLPREIEEAGQVLAISRSFGTGRFGEGKYGGVEEVWVLARSGKRPLSKVLKSVEAVWTLVMRG